MRTNPTLETPLPPVSVIISAYNEERWIETTISSLLKSGFPCEVIVVHNGSTDKTPAIQKSFGTQIKVITHPVNRGKGAAMASGIRNATGEIAVFCDAHLLGLSQYHLLTLVLPLICGSARAVLGADIPEGVPLIPFYSPAALILTGQRAYFREDLTPLIEEMEGLGYGVETFLYDQLRQLRTVVVSLPGLVHLTKRDTSSTTAAVLAYLRESVEILETLANVQGLDPRELLRLKEMASSLIARVTTRENGKAIQS